MNNIEEHAAENVNKILLGNKCDLLEKKVVDSSRGQALADEYNILFLETSAKNNTNVEEAFFSIARDIKARLIDSNEPTNSNPTGATFTTEDMVGQGTSSKKDSKGCCG
jgi:Ras-related protein Rab-8A